MGPNTTVRRLLYYNRTLNRLLQVKYSKACDKGSAGAYSRMAMSACVYVLKVVFITWSLTADITATTSITCGTARGHTGICVGIGLRVCMFAVCVKVVEAFSGLTVRVFVHLMLNLTLCR